MGDFKEPLCEDCGGEKMKKQLGTPNFQLKGGGWYKDGYSDKKLVSSEEQIERSTVKETKTNTATGKTTTISEKPLDKKDVYSRREEENKKTKVTADDFKDRWVSESEGQKVVNI